MSKVEDYLRTPVFSGETNGVLPLRFGLQDVSEENGVALQPILSLNDTIAAETGWYNPSIPSGVVLVYNHLNITIDDIDSEYINESNYFFAFFSALSNDCWYGNAMLFWRR